MTQSPVATYNIRNPYVIILGISEYDNERIRNLPSVVKDVENMKELFGKQLQYNHVHTSLNKLVEKIDDDIVERSCTRQTVQSWLRYHSGRINNINHHIKNDNMKIDGLIFIYSGHGRQGSIVCSDGSCYPQIKMRDDFSGNGLLGKPKIFIYDCCRGNDVDEDISKGTNSNNNSDFTTSNSHMFHWYATSEDYQAFVNKEKGTGCLLGEFYDKMTEYIKNNQYYHFEGIVKAVSHNAGLISNSRQTPTYRSSIYINFVLRPSREFKLYTLNENGQKNYVTHDDKGWNLYVNSTYGVPLIWQFNHHEKKKFCVKNRTSTDRTGYWLSFASKWVGLYYYTSSRSMFELENSGNNSYYIQVFWKDASQGWLGHCESGDYKGYLKVVSEKEEASKYCLEIV